MFQFSNPFSIESDRLSAKQAVRASLRVANELWPQCRMPPRLTCDLYPPLSAGKLVARVIRFLAENREQSGMHNSTYNDDDDIDDDCLLVFGCLWRSLCGKRHSRRHKHIFVSRGVPCASESTRTHTQSFCSVWPRSRPQRQCTTQQQPSKQ